MNLFEVARELGDRLAKTGDVELLAGEMLDYYVPQVPSSSTQAAKSSWTRYERAIRTCAQVSPSIRQSAASPPS